ncbi:outer membrane beta-barrel protein [Halocola ammonii]
MKLLLSIALFFLATAVGFTQSIGGVNFNIFNTLDDFNENVDAAPKGVSFAGLYQIKNSQWRVGGELGVAMYSGETYNQEIIINGAHHEVEVFEEDCFFTYQGVVRYTLFEEAMFNPYAEAKIGGTSFFSTIMVSGDEQEEYVDDYPTDTDFHGTAFHTSFGAGVMIAFGKNSDFGIDLSASYMPGSRARYRNMAASDAFQSNLDEGTFESRTNQLNYRIGVFFLLY